ncbi:MAG: hypothetical protein J3K34DRAFT_428797 [Monoraphidium minutum]|nr:MAG: hypothetical protein J3K34DRAFT_428797 [Monoraphidium minutum]
MASDQNKTALDIEREQEALLAKKYGGMLNKRKQPLMPKEHKYFDSADWALAKEGKAEQPPSLPPRTSPATAAAHHRASKLEG